MESLEQYLESKKPAKPKKSIAKRVAIAGAIVFGLLLVGVGLWIGYGYYQNQQFIGQVPAHIRQELTYPVYLPTEYSVTIDRASISYSNGIFQYTASVKNVPVVVTQQPKTSNFDINKFATSQTLSGAQQKQITIGQLLSATLKEKPLHIVDTGNTIITITSTQSASPSALDPLTNSLRKL